VPKRPTIRKSTAAAVLGRLGGLARAKTVRETIPADERQRIARHAAETRWANYRAKRVQDRADEA
jgi:hypothetical protein